MEMMKVGRTLSEFDNADEFLMYSDQEISSFEEPDIDSYEFEGCER